MGRDDDIDNLTRRIAEWIGLSMKIKRGTDTVKVMHETGLTIPQLGSMHILFFEGPQSITDLTEKLGLSTSATSHLVQRLFEQGIVLREEDPADRRQKRISLSPSGKKLVERLMKARHREMRASVETLSPETREMLLRVLDRVVMELGGPLGAPKDDLKE
jgi:DNA-binding MarR family transcriptional regulator